MSNKKIIEMHEPLGPRVLVKVDMAEEVEKLKSTMIEIVEREKHIDRESAIVDTGVVVGIGNSSFQGFGNDEAWVKVGDKVSFLKHAGAIRKINGEDYRILNDTDLLTLITTKEIEEEANNVGRNP